MQNLSKNQGFYPVFVIQFDVLQLTRLGVRDAVADLEVEALVIVVARHQYRELALQRCVLQLKANCK